MTKRRTRLPMLVALLAALLMAAACGSDDNGDPTATPRPSNAQQTAAAPTAVAYPLTIQRSDGQELVIEAPPQRIVSLSAGATEILYALGAQGALVAVDNTSDFPQAAADFPTKVDAYQPNVEAIAALDPDLVIVATDSEGIVGALDQLDIPLYYQDLDTSVTKVDNVLGQIRTLGEITNTGPTALNVIASLSERIDAVRTGVADIVIDPDARPSVYHELDSTFYSVAESTFIGDLYNILRLENIAGDGGGVAYPQLTQEAIVAANPSVIVLADEEFGVTIDSVKARPGWDQIEAVQNDRIYAIDPDLISRPGPRIVDALEQLAQQIYPTRFSG